MDSSNLVRRLALPVAPIVTVAATWAALLGYVQVTPDGATTPERSANSGPYTADFTVKNIGTAPDTFNILCGSMGTVTCTGVSQSVVGLAPGASTIVTATYTVGGQSNGELNLTALSDINPGSDEGYYNVPVVGPPPSNWDVAPFNHDNQAVGRCAAGCFAATFAQGAVPYFSLGVARSVTLVYHGDRMWPKPFLLFNVQKPSGTPQKVWLQVKKAGAFQTFVNGETTLKFTAAASGWQRIGGQLRDSTWATGMYDIDLIVTWDYGGSTTVQTWNTKLLVVNETDSPIARGWTVAGVQRAYVQGDGSVLVTEGDGSAVFFKKSGTNFITPAGEFSKLGPNGSGWRRDYPDSSVVYFNSAGRMTDAYDRFLNHTQLFYDGSNRLTEIRDPQSASWVLSYGTYGVAYIRDQSSPSYRYTYTTVPSNRTLTALKDPDNVSTTFQYDGNLRLWKLTDRRGNTTTLGYQSINGITTGKLATITGPSIPLYTGGTGSPVVAYAPWQTVGVPYTTTATTPYPVVLPDTVLGKVTDPGTHATKFTVDHWGQPVATIDPLGDTTRITYNVNGLPIRTVFSADPTAVDTAAYNANGLATYVLPAGGVATTSFYNPTWVTQADSVKATGTPSQRFFVGTRGRADSVLLGNTYKQRYTYDSRGRITRVTDGVGTVVQRTGYTGTLGNRSADTIPGSRITTYAYDGYGRPTTVSASGLPSRTTYYDIINRADSVRDGVNTTATRFTYDQNGNVLSVTDPTGQVYGFAYNALGWVTARSDATTSHLADTVKYDVEGLLREWKNRRRQTTRYSYDVLHRQTGKGGANTDSSVFGYAANRRIVMAQSRVGGTVTVTDSVFQSILGTVDSAVTNFGGFTRRRQYRSSVAGVLDSVWVSAYTGNTFLGRKYFFNTARGTLDSLRFGGKTTGSRFDANLRDTSSVFAGGDTLSRSYLSWGPPAAVHAHAPVLQSFDRSLEYNTVGQLRHQFTDPMPEQFSRIFGYDGLGRVVRDTGAYMPYDECTYDPNSGWHCPDSTLVVDSVRSLVYDAVGNVLRDSIWRSFGVDTAVTGTYGTGNRITNFNGCSYGTDLDGNVTSRTCGSETVTWWWSSENRLDSLSVGGVKTRFFYDGTGRLVKRDANGTIHYFWWDGADLYAELDAGGAKLMEYSYAGLDRPHAVATADSVVYFARRDGVGNVIGLVDAAKAVRAQYGWYNLWGTTGATENLPAGTTNRARFKGALWMGDVGPDLYYMRARWYEPRTGRFLSEDPIGLAGGINPYGFAGSDPVNAADPIGLELRLRCYWTHEWHTGENEPEYPYLHEHYEQFCGDDAATRAAGLIAATNPYLANGLGSPLGVGGGFVFAGAGATEHPSFLQRCGDEVLSWVANTALDAIALTGIGEGVRIAARGVGVLTRGAIASLADPALSLGFDVAGQVGRRRAIAAAGRQMLQTGGLQLGVGGGAAYEAWDLRNQGYQAAASNSSSLLSLIPGYGFVTSSIALAKCVLGK